VALDETVRSNNERFCAALVEQNLDTLVAHYDADISLLVPGTPPFEGLDAVRAYYTDAFGAGLTAATLSTRHVDDVGTTVIDVGTYWMAVEPPEADRFEATGKYIHVLRRRADGGLAIWRDIFQPDV
jgi:ketosteroid isomerase-like protein